MDMTELLEQHFCCDICMDKYKNPKQLPCLHNFCKSCLATHIIKTAGANGSTSFICPVCRHVCHPPNPDPRRVHEWVDSFPDNFYINNLMATVETQLKAATPAVVERKLESLSREPETCFQHKGEPVTTYCVGKQISVCGICLKSSAHDNCARSHYSPDDARKTSADLLHDFKDRIQTMSSKVQRAEKKLLSRPADLKLQKEQLSAEISHHFSKIKTYLIQSMISKEKEALDILNDSFKIVHSKINSANDEIKSLSGSLTSTEQLFDKLIENRPVGVLSISEAIERQISAYETATSDVERGCGKLDVNFREFNSAPLLMKKFSWGSISVGDGDWRNTVSPSTTPRTSTSQSVDGATNQSVDGTTNQSLDGAINRSVDGATSRSVDGATRQSVDGAYALPPPLASASTSLPATSTSFPATMTSPASTPLPSTPVPLSNEIETLLLRPMPATASIQTDSSGPVSISSQSSISSPSSVTHGASSKASNNGISEASGGSDNSAPSTSMASGGTMSVSQVEPTSAQAKPPLFDSNGYYFKYMREFDGLDQDDNYGASYVGSCPFGENCFLILDRWNRRLKLFQIGGRLLLYLNFPNRMEPWSVTVVSRVLLAISCPSNNLIVKVNVTSSSLELAQQFKTEKGYSSLVYMGRNKYAAGVCNPFGDPRLDILELIDDKAEIVKTLPHEVIYPRVLIPTVDGHLLSADWSRKEVRVYDRDSFDILLQYKGIWRENPLREPVCVARDRKNNIYVLDRRMKCIHVVAHSTGKKAAIFPVGITHDPKVVAVVDTERCYSSDSEVLLIFCGNGKICVYDMITP